MHFQERYPLLAMMIPVTTANASPVTASTDRAIDGRRFFKIQPVSAPVPTATGTTITLQKMPAIGQMFEFITMGIRKHVSNTQPP